MTQAICTKVERHPNADKLNVYQFQYGELTYQIVANHTNIYEVGDLVNIVLGGEVYEDTVIQDRMVRGVFSQGMAVGKI